MNILFILTSIFFSIWTFRNILYWAALWQEKEYRLDRLSTHLKENIKGKRLIVSTTNIIKWLLILGYVSVVFNEKFTIEYQIIIACLYFFESSKVIWELFNHRLKRPRITAKSLIIVVMSSLIITTLYLLPITDNFLWLLILDRLIPLAVMIYVLFFSFPTEVYTDLIVQKAIDKLTHYPDLLVIAVSGSYGKSSTKEFVAQILSEKFNVVKTIGSNNTPIGIAKTVLNKINRSTDIFIVEMGAYKLGEISELCQIVKPRISITTSVSDQHLSLYGSVENAIETEIELLHALPKNGLSLFNGNNRNTLNLYNHYKKKKILYKISEGKADKSDISVNNIRISHSNVSFDLVLHGKKHHLIAPVLGAHMVQNILPGLYLANYLGIQMSVIKKAVSKLQSPPKTMIMKSSRNGAFIIDDTFNASPESVIAALNYLSVFKKKKILVLMPLIELGSNAKKRHYELGKAAGNICDYLFLTNKNFYDDIVRGISDSEGKCIIEVERVEKIAKDIKSIAKKGDAIVLEGKEANFAKII